MKEKIKAVWGKITTFLAVFSVVIGGVTLILLFFFGAVMFGRGLNHSIRERENRERIQFLRDSLQVEVLKKQINEKN